MLLDVAFGALGQHVVEVEALTPHGHQGFLEFGEEAVGLLDLWVLLLDFLGQDVADVDGLGGGGGFGGGFLGFSFWHSGIMIMFL